LAFPTREKVRLEQQRQGRVGEDLSQAFARAAHWRP